MMKMNRRGPGSCWIRYGLALVIATIVLSGCVSLPSDFKQPQVSVRSIALRSLNSLASDFDIVLGVTNPNRKALVVEGLSYTIHLSGYRLLEGVANDIPRIDAYGEAEVRLSAKADLIAGLGLLNKLLARPSDSLDYEFDVEIDLGRFYPPVRVQRSGIIALGGSP